MHNKSDNIIHLFLLLTYKILVSELYLLTKYGIPLSLHPWGFIKLHKPSKVSFHFSCNLSPCDNNHNLRLARGKRSVSVVFNLRDFNSTSEDYGFQTIWCTDYCTIGGFECTGTHVFPRKIYFFISGRKTSFKAPNESQYVGCINLSYVATCEINNWSVYWSEKMRQTE